MPGAPLVKLVLIGLMLCTAARGEDTEPSEPDRRPFPSGTLISVARAKVIGGDLEALEELLERPEAARLLEFHGKTFLHLAASRDRRVAQFLLERGVELDLWTAARLGDAEATERLLAEDPEQRDMLSGGVAPIHAAAGSGDVATLKVLIEAGADPDASTGRGGYPIHWAAVTGSSENVTLLIEHGADPNVENDDGIRPLTWAKNAEAARALVEGGADPLFVQRNGDSALAAAARLGDADVFAYLLSLDLEIPEPMWEKAIKEAIKGGAETRKPIVDAMIEAGVDVDRGLYYAAGFGDLWAAERFLEEGADADARFGQTTVLHAAVEYPLANRRLVERLLEEGASVTVRDGNGFTPLDVAKFDGNRGLLRLLRSHAEQ